MSVAELFLPYVSAFSSSTFVLFASLLLNGSSNDQSSSSTSDNLQSSLPAIVFVSRNPLSGMREIDPGAIPGFGPEYRTTIVGGKLMLRSRNGSVVDLTRGTGLYDVSGPAISWDGRTVVFSAVQHPDSNWRLFRMNDDGTGLAQLTFTDRSIDLSQFGHSKMWYERYDDFDPCFLPDGRIIFASTRYPSVASNGSVLTSNLFVLDMMSGAIHRVTSERNGAEEPTIDPLTGRVVYARWWLNIDRPSNVTRFGLTRDDRDALTGDVANIWHAVTITPDGHDLKLYAGNPRTRSGQQTYKPAVLPDGRLLSTFSSHTALSPLVRGTGVRWFNKGADLEHYIAGVRSDAVVREEGEIEPPYAAGAVYLEGNHILLSYSKDGRDFGVYMCMLDGSGLARVVDLPETLELDARVLAPRPVPPIIEDRFPPPVTSIPPTEDPVTYYGSDTYRFDNMNIFMNGAVDEPIPDAPRVTRDARIRFYMNVSRQNPGIMEPSILLKEAIVHPNGQIHEPDLPADVPLFEQVVDNKGMVLPTTDGKFAHVPGFNYERFGAGPKCVGCHAGHTLIEVPVNGAMAEWFNVSTSAEVSTSSHAAPDGVLLDGKRLIDRRARTGGDTVCWVADEGFGAVARLSWEVPIEVKEFVLYNIPAREEKGTNIVVLDCEIRLYDGSRLVGGLQSTGVLHDTGTRVTVPLRRITGAEIVIKNMSGTIENRSVAGLAEVETIARVYYERYNSIITEE